MTTQKERALELIQQLKPNEEVLRELGDILGRAQNSETCVDGSLGERTWNLFHRVELAAQHLDHEAYAVIGEMRRGR